MAELARAHVHRQAQVRRRGTLRPARQLRAGLLQHEAAQRQDQAALLGQRNELCRTHHAARGVTPAQQHLCAHQARALIHHGLVVHAELAALQPLAHIGLQVQARVHRGLHRRVKEAQRVAPAGLGFVHRQVSALEQFVHFHALAPEQRDADARRAVVVVPAQHDGLVDVGQQLFRHALHLQRCLGAVARQVFQHHHELVATEARHRIALAHRGHQTPRHLDEQFVAHVMAQGVVEHLEVVQVDEQQRALLARALAQHHGALQPVKQQAPVGQTGERIVESQTLDLLLGLLALGDVHGEAVRDDGAVTLAVRHGAGHVPTHAAIGHAHPVFALPGHQAAHRQHGRAAHLRHILGQHALLQQAMVAHHLARRHT